MNESDSASSALARTLASTPILNSSPDTMTCIDESTKSLLTKTPECTSLEGAKKVDIVATESGHYGMGSSGSGNLGGTLPGIGEFTNAYSPPANTKMNDLGSVVNSSDSTLPVIADTIASQSNGRTNESILNKDNDTNVTAGEVKNLGSHQRELTESTVDISFARERNTIQEHSLNRDSNIVSCGGPNIDTISSSSNKQPLPKISGIFSEMASSSVSISSIASPISTNIHTLDSNAHRGVAHFLENNTSVEAVGREGIVPSIPGKVHGVSTANSFGCGINSTALQKKVLNSKAKVLMKDVPLQRKTVGICSPIAIREHTPSSNIIPGIEYLLNNGPKTSSVATLVCYGQPNQSQSNILINSITSNSNGIRIDGKDNGDSNRAMYGEGSKIRTGLTVGSNVSGHKTASIYTPITICDKVVSTVSGMAPGVEYLFHGTRKSSVKKNDRPFLCQTCGNRFRQQSHLQQHIRIHTNDRPYKCRFCEKAFKQKSQINQHERIHTGEKPYKCAMCEKAFAQAGQLVSHKKTHGLNIDQIRQQQRELREKQGYMKRGRRPKTLSKPYQSLQPCPSQGGDQRHELQGGSPPSVIYIMESHPRVQLDTTYNQVVGRPVAVTSTIHYAPMANTNYVQCKTIPRLPKIETVVSLTTPRLPTPNAVVPVPSHYLRIEPPTTVNETNV